jgi:hypothetical protein
MKASLLYSSSQVVKAGRIVCSILIDGVSISTYTTYVHGTECSETSAHTIQTPGNHPKERIHHSEHVVSLESKKNGLVGQTKR